MQACLEVRVLVDIGTGLLSCAISSSTFYVACSKYLSNGISIGSSYVTTLVCSTCLSSGNEKKDCGNFGWKDCSKALLRLKSWRK